MTTEASSWIDIRQIIFPIGYIYVSTDPTSPATLFGGSWTPIEKQFLYCRDPKQTTSLNTGGEATHTLSISEIPKHNHRFNMEYGSGGSHGWEARQGNVNYSDIGVTFPQGGDKPHNNMPPYKEVYAWQRTA